LKEQKEAKEAKEAKDIELEIIEIDENNVEMEEEPILNIDNEVKESSQEHHSQQLSQPKEIPPTKQIIEVEDTSQDKEKTQSV